jgi:hypothetical protein
MNSRLVAAAVACVVIGGCGASGAKQTAKQDGKGAERMPEQVSDPAWPHLQAAIAEAKNHVEVLPPADTRAETLARTQVTLRSTLGAVVYETGGILVDHGWLRLLGSGDVKLPRSLPAWNAATGVLKEGERPPFVLVADDVVGGFFAIDGGIWGAPGHVHYFAPDTMKWEDLGQGYSDFVAWCLAGDLDQFYADYRWTGWESEVATVGGDQAWSIYPLPFAAGDPYPQRSRGVVPVTEIYNLYQDLAVQLKDVPPGTPIEIKFK